MSYATNTASRSVAANAATSAPKRSAVLLYGVFAYIIGVGGLMGIILAMGGIVPVGFAGFEAPSVGVAIAFDVGLVLLFGIQHSVMARVGFKNWIKRKAPAAIERSTYVMASGLLSVLVLALWQPLPGVVWDIQDPVLSLALWVTYACGWAYLLVATFITNHFELMGLRQAYLYFRNIPHSTLPFTRKLMYRYSRHPMMLGFLIGMWAVPMMSATHFALASLLTLYIAVGVFFEECDLIRQFGDTYRQYKKEVAALLPQMY